LCGSSSTSPMGKVGTQPMVMDCSKGLKARPIGRSYVIGHCGQKSCFVGPWKYCGDNCKASRVASVFALNLVPGHLRSKGKTMNPLVGGRVPPMPGRETYLVAHNFGGELCWKQRPHTYKHGESSQEILRRTVPAYNCKWLLLSGPRSREWWGVHPPGRSQQSGPFVSLSKSRRSLHLFPC
jgi:hypothetical protein